jgi:tetratricopeptide (TPR) repeat protein
VADTLGLTPAQVRGFVQAGLLQPARGPGRQYRFTFQDIAFLRTAKELAASHLAGHRVRRALRKLKEQLPDGKPLSGLSLVSSNGQVVVREGEAAWNLESGQTVLDFDERPAATVQGAAFQSGPQRAEASVEPAAISENRNDAEGWYQLGCHLEADSPLRAREAYRRAIEADGRHADAHVNLGRLLHASGQALNAETHYRQALAVRPVDFVASFNLAVALEDLRRYAEAVAAYELALAAEPDSADAHYNLGCLLQRLGRSSSAMQHLRVYRDLVKGP